MSSTVVAIDTSVLIGAERALRAPEGEAADSDMRCLELLKKLEEHKVAVVLPTLAVAEYLVGGAIPPSQEEQEALLRGFMHAPLDAPAAALAGWLRRQWRLAASEGEGPTERSRGEVAADVLVVATAVNAGAKVLYTTDDTMYRPPQVDLEFREPPPFSQPLQLFA